MTKAAGILFVTSEGKALFLKRGPGGDYPGSWCFPGGTTEDGETAEMTAAREAREELGSYPKGDMVYHVRSISPEGVDFTTFVLRVDAEFTPVLNGEHTGYAWAPLAEPPEPLHPGCRIAVQRIGMDELGLARAMAAGQVTSPQRYGNVSLFDMRITGTGVAYRNAKHDEKGDEIYPAEFVYRRPENYLTDEFVARCNGLQVIMMHPPKAILDSKEFAARTVGAMMLPYIKGDEVWGIAKIYDDEAIGALTANQMSTSPGVILGGGDQRYTTEDGTPLLIEGKPSLLDHLAICEKGVWDKGGEPRGVRTDAQSTNGENDMALSEEDMKVLDERTAKTLAATLPGLLKDGLASARADDAGTSGKLDQILNGLASLAKRVDAMEEKEKKADEEDKDKDKKSDAAGCERMDGESDENFKKRSDAFEEKKKADAEEAEKKAKADAEEADKKAKADTEEKAKADAALAAENGDLKARLAIIEKNMPKQITDAERHEFIGVQARFDDVYQAFGKKASFPLTGETVLAYRKRLAHSLKGYSADWKDADIYAVSDSVVFDVAEKAILRDAARAALSPSDLKDGELRAIHRTDENTGVRTTTFVGNGSFIGRMKPRTRYVSRIAVGERARA